MALRIGIVGTGDIGRIHLKSLLNLPGIEVVLAKGRNPQRAERLSEEFGVEVADDFESLLHDSTVKGISICVPNDLHVEYVIPSLEAGKAVLCEKPIALSLEEAERMIRVSERTGSPFRVGHVVRFWPEYRRARDLIHEGVLGSVTSFSARRLVPLLAAVQGEAGWRHQGHRSGGAVLDLLIHDIDFVQWTFGLPDAVTCRGVLTQTGAYEHVFATLEYHSGPLAGIESSFMLQGNPVVMDFRALGSHGSLEFSFTETDFAMHDIHTEGGDRTRPPCDSLVLYRWGYPKEVLSVQPEDPVSVIFDLELAAFVALLQGDDCPELASSHEALDALRVALAARQSCISGERICLSSRGGLADPTKKERISR